MAPARRRRRAVVKTYTPESLLASPLGTFITQPEPTDDGEQRMFCPKCEEPGRSSTPSASINGSKGEWHCLGKCGDGGKISALARDLGCTIRSAATTRPTPTPALPPALENQDAPLKWHDQFMAGARPDFLDFLTTERGLTVETIERFKVGTDGDRITLPVRYRGKWRGAHRYLPHPSAGRQKMLQIKGFGRTMLNYTETLRGNTLPVVVTAGELDSLLLWQEAAGRLAVVTSTNGEGSVPRDLSLLAGREVWVAYDNDDAGRDGAAKFAAAAQEQGAKARVLDLARLGVRDKGADVSDYLLHGGTVGALLTEMARLREVDPDSDDAVLDAMRAAFLELGEPRTDYTAALLTEADILARPPLRYTVDGIVPVGMTTVLFGQPGSFKTFVGLDMQGCVRSGLDWHGHAVSPGAVMLLEAEGVQQLQARLIAWAEHHGNPDMAAFRALDEPLDLSTPEGAAALVRTVHGMEAATGERVALVWVDPAALYMSGSENEDGNRGLVVGLNAVAKYLDIGLVLIAHTNATGERARGTDHFRMLAGSHIKVERLEDGAVGVVQEKVKNASPRAVILRVVEVGTSVAFETAERMSALDYLSRKDRSAWTAKTTHRLSEARAARATKDDEARELLLSEVAKDPGVVQGKLLARCKGHHIGHELLLANLDQLVADGAVRVEVAGTGKNAPKRHYVAGGDDA